MPIPDGASLTRAAISEYSDLVTPLDTADSVPPHISVYGIYESAPPDLCTETLMQGHQHDLALSAIFGRFARETTKGPIQPILWLVLRVVQFLQGCMQCPIQGE